MAKKEEMPLKLWGAIFAINFVALYVVSLVFPNSLVIGNAQLAPVYALAISSLVLTLLLSLVGPAINSLKIKIKGNAKLSIVYTLVNIVSLWIIARGANYTGLGISSFYVAIALGLLLSVLQYIAWKKLFEKGKKGKK